MKEHRIEIKKTGFYYTAGGSDDPPKRVIFALHGYGQLGRTFGNDVEHLADDYTLLVIPEGLNKFHLKSFRGDCGANWQTSEKREDDIADHIGYLDGIYRKVSAQTDLSSAEITFLCFSSGVSMACQWIAARNIRADRLILWAGIVPQNLKLDIDNNPFFDPRIYLVYGDHDEFADERILKEQDTALEKYEINYKLVRFKGGHEIDKKVLNNLFKDRY